MGVKIWERENAFERHCDVCIEKEGDTYLVAYFLHRML
jgi:hypothetical protein